jgi:surface antigen
MRAARVAIHLGLPTVGLAALAVVGVVRPAPSPTPTVVALSQGGGSVQQVVVVRVVTDGHPQLITLPAQHPSLVVPATAARRPLPQPAARTVTRTVTVAPAPAPAPVRTAAPKPAPTAAPHHATTTTGDTYPYATDTSNRPDPWGFTMRQCVSYVAWRLADAGRPIDNAQGWGSASGWDDTARQLGYTVTTRPTVGSVAQWDAHESSPFYANGGTGSFVAGSMGHVAWVTKVYSDGSVQVAQYNGSGDRAYSTMHVQAPRYLRL